MNKYSLCHDEENDRGVMEIDDLGYWVKFNDVMEEIKRLEIALYAPCRADNKQVKAPECNCFHMAYDEPQKQRWICPTHGYKKL